MPVNSGHDTSSQIYIYLEATDALQQVLSRKYLSKVNTWKPKMCDQKTENVIFKNGENECKVEDSILSITMWLGLLDS